MFLRTADIWGRVPYLARVCEKAMDLFVNPWTNKGLSLEEGRASLP